MAEIMFLNIISAIKNPGPEIELTAESLKNIELNSDNLRLRWIIVDGSKTAQTLSTISKWQDTVSEFNYIQGEDKGIYDAINKGLSQIRNGSFMIIHSGDCVSLEILELLPSNSPQVICGKASWHDLKGKLLSGRNDRKVNWNLAIMPNHQAMIFPFEFAKYSYSLDFPISADQDLKLDLYKKGYLKLIDTQISSCLEGGISDRKMNFFSALERGKETRRIVFKHYGFCHAAFISTTYFIGFILRINWKNLLPKRHKR